MLDTDGEPGVGTLQFPWQEVWRLDDAAQLGESSWAAGPQGALVADIGRAPLEGAPTGTAETSGRGLAGGAVGDACRWGKQQQQENQQQGQQQQQRQQQHQHQQQQQRQQRHQPQQQQQRGDDGGCATGPLGADGTAGSAGSQGQGWSAWAEAPPLLRCVVSPTTLRRLLVPPLPYDVVAAVR